MKCMEVCERARPEGLNTFPDTRRVLELGWYRLEKSFLTSLVWNISNIVGTFHPNTNEWIDQNHLECVFAFDFGSRIFEAFQVEVAIDCTVNCRASAIIYWENLSLWQLFCYNLAVNCRHKHNLMKQPQSFKVDIYLQIQLHHQRIRARYYPWG